MSRDNPFRKYYDDDLSKSRDFPLIIDVELTNHCNLMCKMCSRNIMKRDKGFMSRETFNLILKQIKGKDVGIRFIRWGEPFLHPHIIDFSNLIKSSDHLLHITNNGLVISESNMRAIIDMKLDSIIFSMQGLNKKEYEYIRGAPYDILEANIKKLVEMRRDRDKPYIHITTTADDIKGKNRFLNKWSKIVDEVSVGKTNWERLDQTTKRCHIPCTEVHRKLSVDWDGKVTACCGDYDNLLTIGNIHKNSLYDIWNNNPQLDGIRALLDNMNHRALTLCKDCYPAHNF